MKALTLLVLALIVGVVVGYSIRDKRDARI
jgi:uncharacterized protein YneF (UPF0154 family)